jgi:hypothetical protein
VPTPAPAPRHRLSPDEVGLFRREGYVIHGKPVLPVAKFDGLRSFFDGMLGELEAGTRPESMDVPHFQFPRLFEWLFADEILDLVEPITGPDIALFSSHFICKPRGNGKRVPWHEDSHYWAGTLSPMEVVTVWLAIDPSRTENGCMRVIPRTHNTGRMGYSDYDDLRPGEAVFANEITAAQRDPGKAVAIELEPNECSLHDARIIHGSEPNTSTLRRCGYTMRYMSAAVRFNHEEKGEFHNIYLARGRDLAGNRYSDPALAYPDKVRFRTRHGKNAH